MAKWGSSVARGWPIFWLGHCGVPAHWRDSQFRLEGPAVAQMQAAFMDKLDENQRQSPRRPVFFPELDPRWKGLREVSRVLPATGTESVRLMYLLSIAAARKSIRISVPYFVPGKLITQQLVEARKRGVKVEIIVARRRDRLPPSSGTPPAQMGTALESGHQHLRIRANHVSLQIMIVDDLWVSVGSANIDSRSFPVKWTRPI